MTATNYLDHVQAMRHHLVTANSLAARLRDCGTVEEKQYYNKLRSELFRLEGIVEDLEQSIIKNNRHDMRI